MKFTKLSLAALAAISFASSAFAVENVKVDGQIKLWYQTAKSNGANQPELFNQNASTADLVAKLGVSGSLVKNVGFGLTSYIVTTNGLENNLVAAEQVGSTTSKAGTNGSSANSMSFGEAFITYKMGNTLLKAGRQELGTPLCYSEQWAAVANSFDATVLINTDIPDTTLIAANVTRGNGGNGAGTTAGNPSLYGATASAGSADFSNFFIKGAYAVAMVNKSIPGVVLHPVYYDVLQVGRALWIDTTITAIPMVKVEALYTSIDADNGTFATAKTTDAYAVKASGSVMGVTLGAAYSGVGGKSDSTHTNGLNAVNFGTYGTNGETTKIYTAGAGGTFTGRAAGHTGVSGWKVDASGKLPFDVTLTGYYNSFTVDKLSDLSNTTKKYSPSSFGLIVDKKIDAVDVHAAYISEDKINVTDAKQQVVRVVASIKF
jgi:imipenem/basic amino acid-specific outer membrane pore